ncbi:MAG: LytTR family DNA-binding domain-containing protein [Firmicutes bacterium]|nr:LytTR family DNA-binding domain-containing protein [Bacillota bacterium]
MRICLVDDDSIQLEYLNVLIGKWSSKHNVHTELSFYLSAEEMLFENNATYPFDMIILDIQMGKINGIELAKKIRQTDQNVIIAFISGMADYVFEGYEVQAFRYILKPVKENKIYELLDYANTYKEKEHKYLIISVSGEMKKIKYDDIIYFESMGHYVVFHLENLEYDYKYNISELCLELSESEFIRTHRSYVVNVKYIEKITKNECQLINHITVPLSRQSYKAVNEKFINYYKGKGV